MNRLGLSEILQDVEKEMDRQDSKWGIRHQHNMIWLTILMEELGEVCEAILKKNWIQVKVELIQVIAVGLQWLIDNDSYQAKSDDWEAG